MTAISERRIHTRYNAHHIKVLIKPFEGGADDWELGEISSVDFNRYGIGLETSKNFSVGDIVMLVIRTDDACISEVPGIVCNRSQCDDGYRFGIRFEYEESGKEQTLSEELLMLEQRSATVH
jgi:hypothetical protein